jgi:hypothetical protein
MNDAKTVLAKYEPGKGDGWRNKARWDEDDQAIYDALAASEAKVEALEYELAPWRMLAADWDGTMAKWAALAGEVKP